MYELVVDDIPVVRTSDIVKMDDFVKIIIKRQMEKSSDTFMIIYGARRTGKSTLGMQLLRRYLKLKRKIADKLAQLPEDELTDSWRNYKKNYNWKPPNSWKQLFNNHFAASPEDLVKKIRKLPSGSFVFIDEGIDIGSWQHMMESGQIDLVELILKAGKKGLFTIFVTPSISLLRKQFLAEAHYLAVVPKEPRKGKLNIALLLRNSDVQAVRESQPFGILHVHNLLKKSKHVSTEQYINRIRRLQSYVGHFVYGPLKPGLYELYDRLVKDPLIMKTRRRRRVVSKTKYDRLLYALQTMLYNLKVKAGYTYAQLESMLTDKWGNRLWSKDRIRAAIESMTIRTEPFDAEGVEEELDDTMLLDKAIEKIKEESRDIPLEEDEEELADSDFLKKSQN